MEEKNKIFSLTGREIKIFKKLNSPAKIQDFLNKMPMNFEEEGDTCFSPRIVLRKKVCHCMEGAALAALALRFNGYEPLLVDLKANKNDFDHVIAVFQKDKYWGAISKTNHAVLRYREPIYRSIRELAMSYFHEYQDDLGRKNLRSFSRPVNLEIFDKKNWMTTLEDIDFIAEYIDKVKHYPIINRRQIRNLRRADEVELEAGGVLEWERKRKK